MTALDNYCLRKGRNYASQSEYRFEVSPTHQSAFTSRSVFCIYQSTHPEIQTPFSKVQSFLSLEDDWDGYGACAVPIEVVKNALLLLATFDPFLLRRLSEEDVTPSTYGTIVFDWYGVSNETLSIEVGTTKIGGFLRTDTGELKKFEYDVDEFIHQDFAVYTNGLFETRPTALDV